MFSAFIGGKLALYLSMLAVLLLAYLFFILLQKPAALWLRKILKGFKIYSVTEEYKIQKYVFQHSTGLPAKFYYWVNEQITASGLKRAGVTPFGYTVLMVTGSFIVTFVFALWLTLSLWLTVVLLIMTTVIFFTLARVQVSGAMERREARVMDAMDLIIPEIGSSGVKNAITRYIDNFDLSIRGDFKVFLNNIQERGMSFDEAMYLLADSMGSIFRDFAYKAVFFENVGDKAQKIIFDDIVETNRLRRELRSENTRKFFEAKLSFSISTGIVVMYFGFLMLTDSFSRNFFLYNDFGIFLLFMSVAVIFGVLAYIVTLQSKVF